MGVSHAATARRGRLMTHPQQPPRRRPAAYNKDYSYNCAQVLAAALLAGTCRYQYSASRYWYLTLAGMPIGRRRQAAAGRHKRI